MHGDGTKTVVSNYKTCDDVSMMSFNRIWRRRRGGCELLIDSDAIDLMVFLEPIRQLATFFDEAGS
jgi:hypothetical protein